MEEDINRNIGGGMVAESTATNTATIISFDAFSRLDPTVLKVSYSTLDGFYEEKL